jgi:hypothetical protein
MPSHEPLLGDRARVWELIFKLRIREEETLDQAMLMQTRGPREVTTAMMMNIMLRLIIVVKPLLITCNR